MQKLPKNGGSNPAQLIHVRQDDRFQRIKGFLGKVKHTPPYRARAPTTFAK